VATQKSVVMSVMLGKLANGSVVRSAIALVFGNMQPDVAASAIDLEMPIDVEMPMHVVEPMILRARSIALIGYDWRKKIFGSHQN
jgi:hypothetical protein